MAIQTFMNGTEMKEIYHNGSRLDEMYMNGVIVYKRMLEIDLDQQSNDFTLRSYIDARNSINADTIVVSNSKTQPTMNTGNLAGLEVTFINNGELRGTNNGDNALNVTSLLKLINNGWIRGAGGKGGQGGRGGRGTTGAKGSDKTISYSGVPTVHTWTDITNLNASGSNQGWQGSGSANSGTYTSPCGKSVTIADGNSGSVAGVTITHLNALTGGIMQCFIPAGSCSSAATGTLVIDGGAGGAGGTGGTGGAGGNADSFKTTSTPGLQGSVGSSGSSGLIKSWTDPTGTVHHGNRGGTGGTGRTGGTGGKGGVWGATGAKGGTGTSGSAGTNGQAGGLSISGRGNLTGDSIMGSISGTTN